MRVQYAPTEPSSSSPEDAAIYERIRSRRKPRPLLPLDLALLHSPPLADGYNAFIGALRTKTVVDQSTFELAICRIAVLNEAAFEWKGHAHLALKAGVKQEVLDTIRKTPEIQLPGDSLEGLPADGDGSLSLLQWKIVAFADAMTRRVRVSSALFASVKEALGGEREIVELVAAISAYNMVARFLVALDVAEMNDVDIKSMVP